VVTVTRIDRLARSTFDLFAIVKRIVDAGAQFRSPFDLFAIVKRIVDAGAQFRSLAEPWADTATSTGRLMIAVLGGLADVERDLIRTRTAEGRSRAKARAGSTWAVPPPLRRSSRRRPASAATRARRSRSWPKATTWASQRFPAYRRQPRDICVIYT
jgi:DNA invertase Pin-like site-specific DNA recombinase